MKKIIVLLSVLLSTSVYAQQILPIGTKKPTTETRLIQITTADDQVLRLMFTFSTEPGEEPVQQVTLLSVNDEEKVELTEAFYFKNGKELFKVGKNFSVVAKPATDPQREFSQNYIP